MSRGFFGGRGIARPPSSSHPRCVHRQCRCVLRRKKDWHLFVEEFSGGGGIGPPPHISGEYFGGGGTGAPPHNVGEYFGGEGTGPSPHNVAVYISLGPQLTARALEAVRFWWVELGRCFGAFSVSLLESIFREHAPCPSRQQYHRGSAGAGVA